MVDYTMCCMLYFFDLRTVWLITKNDSPICLYKTSFFISQSFETSTLSLLAFQLGPLALSVNVYIYVRYPNEIPTLKKLQAKYTSTPWLDFLVTSIFFIFLNLNSSYILKIRRRDSGYHVFVKQNHPRVGCTMTAFLDTLERERERERERENIGQKKSSP